MNVLQSTQKLIKWFETHDSFNLEDNFEHLLPLYVSDTIDADKASLISALDELVNSGVLRKSILKKKEYYNLIKSLSNLTQTINLSYFTVQLISQILTEYSEIPNNKDIGFNPLQIEEKDILLSLSILNELANLKNKTK